MSERPRSPHPRLADRRAARASAPESDPEPLDTSLWPAIGVAAGGAVLQIVGLVIGVVDAPAGYTSWPLAAVLALVPPVAAVIFVGNRRPAAASALLVVFAAVSVGRAVAAVQLAVDASRVSRPDLVAVSGTVPPNASFGLWLLILGFVVTVVAGVLARDRDRPAEDEPRRGLVVGAAALGLLIAIGLVMAPFSSSNPLLPADGVFDSPALALVGGLLVALVMPVGAAVAASSGDADTVRGGILGVGLAALVVGLPPAVAGYVLAELHPSTGPWIALVGIALLVPFAFVSVGRREKSLDQDVDLPGRGNLHLGAGIVGLLAAVSGLVAVALPLLSLPNDAAVPENYAIRLLTPASVLVGVLAVGLLVPAWAALVRPAFSVACAGIVLAVASGFDNVLSATGVITSKATPGAGVWFGALAVLLALVAVIIATLAGASEREDVDLSELEGRPVLGWVAGLAALLAVGAFGFPAVTGPDYESAGLWTFRIASTGSVVALVAVIVAAALAARSRPSRGAALLFGAAGVAVVRALEFAFTGGRVAGSAPALGTWLAVGCTLVLAAGGILAVSMPRVPRGARPL
ncbi:hypothetical protein [Kutzneria kofuensis]|uniref:Uncharacterized protein n=1 Tax=Kutzneria kofuensis TaxID=103725 RepID=A0A7W9KIW1_9PSEU|nr:hypothetical protein [Kutzneria kofuensis]MBB5893366.1 hypothetical protein [Kutzneria kofuensis]